MDYLIMFIVGFVSGITLFVLSILWLNWRFTRKRHNPPTKDEWKVM